MVGHGGQQHCLVGTSPAAGVDLAQAVMLEQTAEDGFHGALA